MPKRGTARTSHAPALAQKTLRIGILELIEDSASESWTDYAYRGLFKRLHASITPQAVAVWCRQRFGSGVTDLKIARYMYPFDYPFAPAKVVDIFIEYYGPTNRAHASLDEAVKKALQDDLTALWTRNNEATDGTTRVRSEYIEVIGTR